VYGKRSGVYRGLAGKSEGKESFGKARRRWEDNIKMDHHELGTMDVDWIDLAQNRDKCFALVNAVMNLQVT
jgi:hypothetical protein